MSFLAAAHPVPRLTPDQRSFLLRFKALWQAAQPDVPLPLRKALVRWCVKERCLTDEALAAVAQMVGLSVAEIHHWLKALKLECEQSLASEDSTLAAMRLKQVPLTRMERRQVEAARAEIAAVGVTDCSPATRQTIAHLVAIGCCSLETMSQLVGIPAETLRQWCGQDRKMEEEKAEERAEEQKEDDQTADDRPMQAPPPKARPTTAQPMKDTVQSALSPRPISQRDEAKLVAARAEIALRGERDISRSTRDMLIHLVESGRDSHTISELVGMTPETLQRWVEESQKADEDRAPMSLTYYQMTPEDDAKLQAIKAEITEVGEQGLSQQTRQTLISLVGAGYGSGYISRVVGIRAVQLRRWMREESRANKKLVASLSSSLSLTPEAEAKLQAARAEIAAVGTPRCSVQTRETLVQLVESGQGNIAQISKQVDIAWITLNRWVKQYRKTGKVPEPARPWQWSPDDEAKLNAAREEIAKVGAQGCSVHTRKTLFQLVEAGCRANRISKFIGIPLGTFTRWMTQYRQTGKIDGPRCPLTAEDEATLQRAREEMTTVGVDACSHQTRGMLIQLVEAGRSIVQVSQGAGVSAGTLTYWVEQYRQTGMIVGRHLRLPTTDEEAQLARAKAEIDEVGGAGCSLQTRTMLIQLVEAGILMSTVAQRVGMKRVTLQSWVSKYQKTGKIPQPQASATVNHPVSSAQLPNRIAPRRSGLARRGL